MQAVDTVSLHSSSRQATGQEPQQRTAPRPVFVSPRHGSPVRRGGRRPGAVAAPSARPRTLPALASDVGQGTVEYVGLLLLMASVLAAVVAAAGTLGGKDKIGDKVVTQVGESIDRVSDKPKK